MAYARVMGDADPSRALGLPLAVGAWCRQWLDAVPVGVLFHTRHLSDVWGLRFAQRPPAVIKIRPNHSRLVACTVVQQHLWAHSFPCPEPLAGPAPLGDRAATAEAAG